MLMNRIRSIACTLKVILPVFIFINCSFISYASDTSAVFAANGILNARPIGKYVYLFVDKGSHYNISDIVHSAGFKRQKKDIPVMDVKEGIIWLKFSILNQTANSNLFLDIQYSNISEIALYKLENNKLSIVDSAGNSLSKYKQHQKKAFVFDLKIPPSDTGRYFCG